MNYLLSISFNICFVCSKELSHLDGSFEYPQHMFWLRNQKIIFITHSYLKPLVTCGILKYFLYESQGSRLEKTCLNQSAQLHRLARILKFCMWQVKLLYFPAGE